MPDDHPFPPGALVAAYLRDSGGADQTLSVPQQEAAAREWASAHGVTLSRVFADIARSGTTTAGREQFLEMMAYFSGGDVPEKGIVLYEFSRFGRAFDDVTFYLSDLRRQGFVVHSLVDNIPAGLDGRLLESILHWKNAKYSLELGRNVTRGLVYNARAYHAYQSQTPPVGYIKHQINIGEHRDGKPHYVSVLQPDPATKDRVIQAFTLRAEGRTYAEIHRAVKLLHADLGYAKMLRNKIYLGIYSVNEETIPGFCEPLISPELFDAVQATFYTVNRSRPSKGYLLTGLGECPECGGPLAGVRHKDRHGSLIYRYYYCSRRMRGVYPDCQNTQLIHAAELERRVIARAEEYLSDPAIIEAVCKEAGELAARLQQETDTSQAEKRAELKQVTASIARTVAAIREAGHSRALLEDLKTQEARQLELEQAIQAGEAQRRTRIARLPSPDQIRAAYEQMRASLESIDGRTLQLALRSFIKSFKAKGGDVIDGTITFIAPTGQEITVKL